MVQKFINAELVFHAIRIILYIIICMHDFTVIVKHRFCSIATVC